MGARGIEPPINGQEPHVFPLHYGVSSTLRAQVLPPGFAPGSKGREPLIIDFYTTGANRLGASRTRIIRCALYFSIFLRFISALTSLNF